MVLIFSLIDFIVVMAPSTDPQLSEEHLALGDFTLSKYEGSAPVILVPVSTTG
jgi:hypothetical protein